MSRRTARDVVSVDAEPLQVLMVTNNWVYGGRERVIQSLCEGFRELLGWDTTLVVARRHEAGAAACLERFPAPRGTPVTWLETARWRSVAFGLGRILRRTKPDVIFWHPDVATFPVYWVASVLSHSTNHVVAVYHGFEPTLRESERPTSGERLSGIVARRVSMSVAVSTGTALTVEKRLGLPSGSVEVIRNPVDAQFIRSQASGTDPEELAGRHPVVLVVARLSPEKDWDTLLRAFTMVATTARATLCIVGEGPERERIVRLARDAGVADRVLLTGNRPNPYRYMSCADVFVLSSHHEGFGMVLLEAMACGVPVVATDCESGPREIITHGQSGLLVAPQDPLALADSILSVLRDTDLAGRLRQGGLKRADEFGLRDAVEAYRQVAERVGRRSWRGARQSDDGQPASKTGSHVEK
jgi:glycosyltransferase involved in cell wall biosynthesis